MAENHTTWINGSQSTLRLIWGPSYKTWITPATGSYKVA